MVEIFLHILLPIFLLIGLGSLLDRAFSLDLGTLSKMSFYAFVPALVFIELQGSEVAGRLLLSIAAVILVHLLLLAAVAWLVFNRRWIGENRSVPRVGSIFYNAGNFGIPLAQMFFGSTGVAVMAVILMVQNFMSFTLGIAMLARDSRGAKGRSAASLAALAKVPVLWAIVLALVLPEMQGPVIDAAGYLAEGLIPVVLMTLGIQLGRCRFRGHALQVGLVTGIRLVLSPLLMGGLLLLWPYPLDNYEAILLVAAGLPVAVNTHLLALEYKVDPEVAAQQVFWTTLLGGLSITLLLYLVS